MDDYSNIKHIIIRRPVTIEMALHAMILLQTAQNELDALKESYNYCCITPAVFGEKMARIDSLIDRAVQLSGFVNANDMKYYIEHFN